MSSVPTFSAIPHTELRNRKSEKSSDSLSFDESSTRKESYHKVWTSETDYHSGRKDSVASLANSLDSLDYESEAEARARIRWTHRRTPSLSMLSDSLIPESSCEIQRGRKCSFPSDSPSKSKFKRTVDEIITSEIKYLEKLVSVREHFIKPIEAHYFLKTHKTILDDHQIRLVFLNMPELIDLSEQIIRLFQEKTCQEEVAKNMPLLLESIRKQFVESFSYYSSNYDAAIKLRKNLRDQLHEFALQLKVSEYCSGWNVDSLQIEPVQRMMRYHLLLESCIKACDPKTRENISLKCAYGIMQDMLREIEEIAVKESSKRMVVLLQENLFQGKVSFFDEHRFCIRFATLCRRQNLPGTSYQKKSTIFVILFSDCLVYASISKDRQVAKFKHGLPLAGLRVQPIFEDNELPQIHISSTLTSLTLGMESEEDRDQWVRDILLQVDEEERAYKDRQEFPPSGKDVENKISKPRSLLPNITISPEECPWLQL